MKIGVLIEGQEGLTWERWRRLVQAVEGLGFESLWRSDHLLSIQDPAREVLETWTSLAVAAAETSRLLLGPLVCPITFRPPAVLAQLALAVDRLSGGRLVLGVGAGWNELEHRAFGLDFPPPGERLDRLAEGIEVIRRLQDEGPAHFEGRYYRLDGAPTRTGSAERPRIPLLVAGTGERRSLPLVARYADQWDASGGLSPDEYRAKNARLNAFCRQLGRDPKTILRSASTAYLIYRDEAELRDRCDVLCGLLPDLAGVTPAEVPDRLRAWNWRVGTPEQLAADLRALGAAGAERVVLQHNDYDDVEALELVAREVLPEVTGYRGQVTGDDVPGPCNLSPVTCPLYPATS